MRRVAWAHALAPLLVGAAVVVGVVIVLHDVVTTPHLDLGYSQAIANDGRALAVGHSLYGDPTRQYTAMLYAPMTSAVLAGLYRLHWWDGWALIVSTSAAVGLAVLAGGIAASGQRGRSTLRMIAAGVGVGGVALWFVTTNAWGFVFNGRVDQLAWFFALSGLCVAAWCIARRPERLWLAVPLLTAAVWTKQLTIGAAVAVVVVTAWLAWSRRVSWRSWWTFVVALAVTNVVVLLTLLAVTRGWIWFSIYEIGARKHVDPAWGTYLSEVVRLFVIPASALAVVLVAAGRPRGDPRTSITAALWILLIAFVAVELPMAFLARRQQGAGPNEFIGIMWAFGFALALAHRQVSRDDKARPLLVGTVVYLALALIAFVPPLSSGLSKPKVVEIEAVPSGDVESIDSAVVAYARSHLVYDARLGIVSSGRTDEVWPSEAELGDVLAAGKPVDYLVDALIARRFDAVTLFPPLGAAYIAEGGRTSFGYLPALNYLIGLGYRDGANDAPSPLLGRRPRDVDLSWARRCFSESNPLPCMQRGTAS